MDRESYNSCLRPFISGSMPQAERKLNFCIGAKVCSGKAKNEEEAKAICLLPKEPKEPKARKRKEKPSVSCRGDMITLSQCMAEKIDLDLVVDPATVETALVDALLKCRCGI